MAYTDYLTGLPNRARLMSTLGMARARAATNGRMTSFLLLDLDGFKPVNDVAGHEAGDHLLIQVAERLRATVRDGDLVGRLGGDEFAVLVADGIEGNGAGRADRRRPADRAAGGRRQRSLGLVAPGVVFDISGSIGVTELDPADDVATTIRRADLALRAAKGGQELRPDRRGRHRQRDGDEMAASATTPPRSARTVPCGVPAGRGLRGAAGPRAGGAGQVGPPGAGHRVPR